MLRISDSLGKMILVNRFLRTGLQHRLFNLSQLTRFLKPLVEAQLKKDVQESALLMTLSRVQRDFDRQTKKQFQNFALDKLILQPNLFTVTYSKSLDLLRRVQRFERMVTIKNGYMNVSEGSREITMLVEQGFLEDLSRSIPEKPIHIQTKITGIGVVFGENYAAEPGFLYMILERIAFQGINVVEVFSTYTEFSIFLKQEDARLALDTLLACFEVEEF